MIFKLLLQFDVLKDKALAYDRLLFFSPVIPLPKCKEPSSVESDASDSD